MLSIEHLSKKIGNKTILQDITLAIPVGKIYCIAGSSGAGKSTLLKLIGGILQKDNGNIRWQNVPVLGPDEQLVPGHAEIKLAFQHFELSPNLTVYQNIAEKLRAYNKVYQEERVQQLAAICGLEQLLKSPVASLSGGEQQRLALCRAMAESPEVLLLDEPFSNLDPIIKQRIVHELLRLNKEEKTTILLVSHDMQDGLKYADKIVFLHRGALLLEGKPIDIVSTPHFLIIAELLNLFNIIAANEQLQALSGYSSDEDIAYVILPKKAIVLTGKAKLVGKLVASFYNGEGYEWHLKTIIGDIIAYHAHAGKMNNTYPVSWDDAALQFIKREKH